MNVESTQTFFSTLKAGAPEAGSKPQILKQRERSRSSSSLRVRFADIMDDSEFPTKHKIWDGSSIREHSRATRFHLDDDTATPASTNLTSTSTQIDTTLISALGGEDETNNNFEDMYLKQSTDTHKPPCATQQNITLTKELFLATRSNLIDLILSGKISFDDVQSNCGLLVLQVYVQAPWLKGGGAWLRVGLDTGVSDTGAVIQTSAFSQIVDPIHLQSLLNGESSNTLWHSEIGEGVEGLADVQTAVIAKCALSIRGAIATVDELRNYNCIQLQQSDNTSIPFVSSDPRIFSIESWGRTNVIPEAVLPTVINAAVLHVTRDDSIHMILGRDAISQFGLWSAHEYLHLLSKLIGEVEHECAREAYILKISQTSLPLTPDQRSILRDLHDSRGHCGSREVMRKLNESCSNGNLPPEARDKITYKLLTEYIKFCSYCQMKKFIPNCSSAGGVQTIRHNTRPGQCFWSDAFKMVDDPNGYTHFILVADFSTLALVIVPVFDLTAKEHARAILTFCLRYPPATADCKVELRTDNGPAFVAELNELLAKAMALNPVRGVAYNHEDQGVIENAGKQIRGYFRAVVTQLMDALGDHKSDSWATWGCPMVEYIWMSSYHPRYGFVPFDVLNPLYSSNLRDENIVQMRRVFDETMDPQNEEFLLARDNVETKLREKILQVQLKQLAESLLDNPEEATVVEPGEYILVKHLNDENTPPNPLAPRTRGPFRVSENQEGVKPNFVRITPVINSIGKDEVVHLSWIAAFNYDPTWGEPITKIAALARDEYEIEAILAHRGDPKKRADMKFKVKLVGWEKPEIYSWDQVFQLEALDRYINEHPELKPLKHRESKKKKRTAKVMLLSMALPSLMWENERPSPAQCLECGVIDAAVMNNPTTSTYECPNPPCIARADYVEKALSCRAEINTFFPSTSTSNDAVCCNECLPTSPLAPTDDSFMPFKFTPSFEYAERVIQPLMIAHDRARKVLQDERALERRLRPIDTPTSVFMFGTERERRPGDVAEWHVPYKDDSSNSDLSAYDIIPPDLGTTSSSATDNWKKVCVDPNNVATVEQRERIQTLLESYKHVFDPLIPYQPIKCGPQSYSLSQPLTEENLNEHPLPGYNARLDQCEQNWLWWHLDEMREKGLIEDLPDEDAFGKRTYIPIRMAPEPQKDAEMETKGLAHLGTYYRLCFNAVNLNKTWLGGDNPCYMPDLNVAAASLEGKNFYCNFDLPRMFSQIELAQEQRQLTRFRYKGRDGNWHCAQHTRLMTGANQSPAIAQKIMCDIFGWTDTTWIDDLFAGHSTFEEHYTAIERILKIATEYNVKLSPSKCNVLCDRIKILGRIRTRQGLELTDKYKMDVSKWEYPRSQTLLLGFLGVLVWARHSIPNYANLCKPLRVAASDASLKPNSTIVWTDEMKAAFDELKSKVEDAQLLADIDPTKTVRLFVDASIEGRGCMIWQCEGPDFDPAIEDLPFVPKRVIRYMSEAHNDTQRRWPTNEQEGGAVHWALTGARYEVMGRRTVVYTDHKNLTYILDTRSRKLLRWKLELEPYRFLIVHIPGKYNIEADYLSRAYPRTHDVL